MRMTTTLTPTRSFDFPGPSGGARLMRYLARQVERMDAAAQGVRDDTPDAVHRLRVASRRVRSALRAYRPLLERERTDPVDAGLRDLGRALAPARDAEVLRERIDADLAELPPELAIGPVRAEATRHFARAEAEARAAALAALDGDGYADLRRTLDGLLADPPLTRRAIRPRLDVRPSQRRLRRAMGRALSSGDETDLHRARKAAKRLRYATEVAGTKAKRLKVLQQALGAHQDAVVARGALRDLGATAENGFTFGLLLGRAEARAAAVRAELPRLWKRAL
jgi:CHAD domain-containing protein